MEVIIHIYHHYERDLLKFVFSTKKYSNEIKNGEPDKCKELKWFEIDNLPENIIPKIKEEIENIMKNVYYNSDNKMKINF